MEKIQQNPMQLLYAYKLDKATFLSACRKLYEEQIKSIYEEPGFRKGHVDYSRYIQKKDNLDYLNRSVFESFGKLFYDDVIKDMKKNEFKAISIETHPNETKPETIDHNNNEAIIYQAVVNLKTFIEDINDYLDIEVETDVPYDLTDDIIDQQLDSIKNQYEEVEVAKLGHHVIADVYLKEHDGDTWHQIQSNYLINLDEETLENESEQKLKTSIVEGCLGCKQADEFTFEVEFEAGKITDYKVVINKIREPKRMTDEELVSSIYKSIPEGERPGIDRVRYDLKEYLLKKIRSNRRLDVSQKIFNILKEKAVGINISETEVKMMLNTEENNQKKNAQESGLTMADFILTRYGTLEEYNRILEEKVTTIILQLAIYNKIAEKEKIVASFEEMRDYIKRYFLGIDENNEPKDEKQLLQIRNRTYEILEDPISFLAVKSTIQAYKAEELVLSRAKVKEIV